MNEIIKEIAIKAGATITPSFTDYFGDTHPPIINKYDLDIQEFAKLITSEYDAIIYQYQAANAESDDWVYMLGQMRDKLKQHLGIIP